MQCFLIIRSDKESIIKTALADMERHGNLTIEDAPKVLEPEVADEILVEVLDSELKKPCESAAVAALEDNPGAAIAAVRETHPPAHIIVVSDRYPSFERLKDLFEDLEDLEGYTSPLNTLN